MTPDQLSDLLRELSAKLIQAKDANNSGQIDDFLKLAVDSRVMLARRVADGTVDWAATKATSLTGRPLLLRGILLLLGREGMQAAGEKLDLDDKIALSAVHDEIRSFGIKF